MVSWKKAVLAGAIGAAAERSAYEAWDEIGG
jgi:hypothetical protein